MMLLHGAVRVGVAHDIVVITVDTLRPLNSPCPGFSMGIRTVVVVTVQVAVLFFFLFFFFLESDCGAN